MKIDKTLLILGGIAAGGLALFFFGRDAKANPALQPQAPSPRAPQQPSFSPPAQQPFTPSAAPATPPSVFKSESAPEVDPGTMTDPNSPAFQDLMEKMGLSSGQMPFMKDIPSSFRTTNLVKDFPSPKLIRRTHGINLTGGELELAFGKSK